MTKFVKTQHPRAPHRRLAVFEYKKVSPIADASLLGRIVSAWKATRSPLWYTSFTSIYTKTRIPYPKIFGVLKWLHKANPYAVRFNIDRTGNIVYFKLLPNEVAKC